MREHIINEKIKNQVILLVQGVRTQEMTKAEALALADAQGLDLVELADANSKSTCKLMDYNKFLYAQNKKQKAAKSVKQVVQKEVRMSCSIEEHDLEIFAKRADRILNEGDKVKVTVVFKGRLMRNFDKGGKILSQFMSYLPANIVSTPMKSEGNLWTMVLDKKV